MKKFFACICMIFTLVFGVVTVAPAAVYADNNSNTTDNCDGNGSAFFSLKPWYAGVTESVNGNCEVKSPDKGDGEGFAKFIWTIVLNILYDLTVMAGYLTIIMVAWGGYLYMFSSGMADRAEKGKKTLTAAFIGLAIAMLASVILNTISVILIG